MKKVKEGLGDLASAVELDHEVQMARSDLYKLAKYAIKLHNMLKNASEEQGLEGWVQSKITTASQDISDVYHSLEYEMKFGDQGGKDLGQIKDGGDTPMPFESVNPYKNKLAEKLNRSLNENAPLTPGVRVSGKMIKYQGIVFTFAGRGAVAPKGDVIVVPPQVVGQRPKFEGMGVPVVLDPQNKRFFLKPTAAPQAKTAGKAFGAQSESTEQDVEEKESPAGGPPCWQGKKIGNPKTKISSTTGKRVNNCVPAKG